MQITTLNGMVSLGKGNSESQKNSNPQPFRFLVGVLFHLAMEDLIRPTPHKVKILFTVKHGILVTC